MAGKHDFRFRDPEISPIPSHPSRQVSILGTYPFILPHFPETPEQQVGAIPLWPMKFPGGRDA